MWTSRMYSCPTHGVQPIPLLSTHTPCRSLTDSHKLTVGARYACAHLVLVWTSNVICWPAEKRAITQAFVNALGKSASIYG